MRPILPLFLIAVALFLTFGYTMPMWDEAQTLVTEKSDLDNTLGNTKAFKATIDGKIVEYNAFDSVKREKLDKMISDNIDNVRIIMNLNNIAANHGMTIRNITMKTGVGAAGSKVGPDTKDYNVASIGLTVSAPYSRFLDFLKDLEKSLPLVDVSSLSFSSGDKDIYDFNLEVKTYWLKNLFSELK